MRIVVLRIVVSAAFGLIALTGTAFAAAQSGQYGGPTSQKVGSSRLRIDLTVSHGAVADVRVGAVVVKGGGLCPINDTAGLTLEFT